MNFLLRWRLWRTRQSTTPAPAFRRELWRRLGERLAILHAPAPVWYRTHWFRATVASASSVAVCASFATGAYAYTSPDVAVGTPLYPIKHQLESVEGSLQHSPSQKAAFLLKQIKRRESEAETLRHKQQPTVAAEAEIHSVEKELEDVSTQLQNEHDTDPKVQERVQKRLEERKQKLENKEESLEDKIRPPTARGAADHASAKRRREAETEGVTVRTPAVYTESDTN